MGEAQSEAQPLGAAAQYLFDNPGLFPGIQQGNAAWATLPDGAQVDKPGSPVGVFVPSTTPITPSFWNEVNLVSHLDPFLETMYRSRSLTAILRMWILTPDGMIRAVPDPGYGYPDSPVSAITNLTTQPFYQQASVAQGPTGMAVWTPDYPDPAGGPSPIASAVVPVRSASGTLDAVVGVDVSLVAVEQTITESLPYSRIALVGPGGAWIAGTAAANTLFLQPAASAAIRSLTSASAPAVIPLPDTSLLLAAVPVQPSGWWVVVAAPQGKVLASALQAAHSARGAEHAVLATVLLITLALTGSLVWVAHAVADQSSRPLRELTRRIRRTAAGDPPNDPEGSGPVDEVALLTQEFDALQDRLTTYAHHLELQVQERARSEEAGERQRLEERNALAREVHDSLAQGFVASLMLAEAAAAEVEAEDWSVIRRRLVAIMEVARDGLKRARASVLDLLPPSDLGSELRRELDRMEDGVAVELRTDGNAQQLPPDIRAALLGIGREALTNIRRHARAHQVSVSLIAAPYAAALEVTDDGQGFDPDAVGPTGTDLRGFGLRSMRARAANAGGVLRITSTPGRGTAVRAEIPLPTKGDGDI